MMNPIFELLTEEEQDELIKLGYACCGSYDSESGCCPFKVKQPKQKQDDDESDL